MTLSLRRSGLIDQPMGKPQWSIHLGFSIFVSVNLLLGPNGPNMNFEFYLMIDVQNMNSNMLLLCSMDTFHGTSFWRKIHPVALWIPAIYLVAIVDTLLCVENHHENIWKIGTSSFFVAYIPTISHRPTIIPINHLEIAKWVKSISHDYHPIKKKKTRHFSNDINSIK